MIPWDSPLLPEENDTRYTEKGCQQARNDVDLFDEFDEPLF